MQKRVTQTAVVAAVIALLLACERKNDNKTPATIKFSEAEVQSRSKPGTSKQELIATFGSPTFEDQQDGDIIWTYILDDGKQSGDRFAGFKVLLRSNIVSEWRAIHAGGSPSQDMATTRPAGAVSSNSSPLSGPLDFFIVHQHSFPKSTFVDTSEHPSLGYIASQPDLRVTRLQKVEWRELPKPNVDVTLNEQDGARFRNLTENANAKILLMRETSIVHVLSIREPIPTGKFRIIGTNATALSNTFRALHALSERN